jgi:hypothetical protein
MTGRGRQETGSICDPLQNHFVPLQTALANFWFFNKTSTSRQAAGFFSTGHHGSGDEHKPDKEIALAVMFCTQTAPAPANFTLQSLVLDAPTLAPVPIRTKLVGGSVRGNFNAQCA